MLQGDTEGIVVGNDVGQLKVGDSDGSWEGEAVGIREGAVDGPAVDGAAVDGGSEGASVGISEGKVDGDAVGSAVVGKPDGSAEGSTVGIGEGDTDGMVVGDCDGSEVRSHRSP